MSSERGLVSDEFAPPEIENVGALATDSATFRRPLDSTASMQKNLSPFARSGLENYMHNAEYA